MHISISGYNVSCNSILITDRSLLQRSNTCKMLEYLCDSILITDQSLLQRYYTCKMHISIRGYNVSCKIIELHLEAQCAANF